MYLYDDAILIPCICFELCIPVAYKKCS